MKNPFKRREVPSVEQIAAQMEHQQRVEHEKSLAKLIWPLIESDALTIYDAQTALTATAGFIAYEVQRKQAELKVGDLTIDMSKEEPSPVRTAVLSIVGLLQDEKADLSAKLLERFGKTLGMYSANQYMKNKMDTLKSEDIVA